MAVSVLGPELKPLFTEMQSSINWKTDLSIIQIDSVSTTSSEDDVSTNSSAIKWVAERTGTNTPLNRHQKWLTAKQQLNDILKLLQEDTSDQTQDADDIENFQDEAIRLELQELALRVQKQFTSPHEAIQTIIQAHHVEAALRYAVHNHIAEHIPSHGGLSYNKLAIKAHVDPFQCKRIVRLLATHHIFAEDTNQDVVHTPASRFLLDHDMQSWVEYSTSDSIASSLRLSDALSKWPSSRDPTETAFTLSHDTGLPMFEHFAHTPGKLDRFRRAMTGMSRNTASSPHHAARGYNWSSLQAGAQVVDVGGGNGHISRAIAALHPSLRITVQDIGVASDYARDGIIYSRYDFFMPQPIRHAEVYLMRQVLHDWSDDFAVNIIRNQVSAMKPSSRLVVMDMVMPEPGDWRLAEERRARATDVTMLTLFNSEERNLSRWIEVMQKADRRLHLTNIVRPPGCILTLLEFSL